MRTFEAQEKDYKDYLPARRDFESFCTRAGLQFGCDDAAGGIQSKFHIHIQKINIEHEGIEINFGGGVNNDRSRSAGTGFYSPLAKW